MEIIKKHYTLYSNSGATKTEFDSIFCVDSAGKTFSIHLNDKKTVGLNGNIKRQTFISKPLPLSEEEIINFKLKLSEHEEFLRAELIRKEEELAIQQILESRKDLIIFGQMTYKDAFKKFGAENEWEYETTTHHFSHFAANIICHVLEVEFDEVIISFPLDKKHDRYKPWNCDSINTNVDNECLIVCEKGVFRITKMQDRAFILTLEEACSISIIPILT